MKQPVKILVIALWALLLMQCQTTKQEESTKDTTSTKTTLKEEAPKNTTESPLTKEDLPKGKDKNAGTPSDNVVDFFTTDYWLPQFAISQLEPKVHERYLDMWLKFKPDGTFYGGTGKQVNIQGKWKFDTPKNMLFIISNNPDIEGKWAIRRSGFQMIWQARGKQKIQDVQIKFVNSSFKPGDGE